MVDLNDDRGPSVNRSLAAIVILSSIMFAGRLTAKRVKKVSLCSSDYTLAVGWLLALAMAAMSFAGKLYSWISLAYATGCDLRLTR